MNRIAGAAACAMFVMEAGAGDASTLGLMFETDADQVGGSELAFNTYASITNLLDGTQTSSMFSQLDVNSVFSTSTLLKNPPLDAGTGT